MGRGSGAAGGRGGEAAPVGRGGGGEVVSGVGEVAERLGGGAGGVGRELLPAAAAPPRPHQSCRRVLLLPHRRGRPPRSILLLPAAAAPPHPPRSSAGSCFSHSEPPPEPTSAPSAATDTAVHSTCRILAGAPPDPASLGEIIAARPSHPPAPIGFFLPRQINPLLTHCRRSIPFAPSPLTNRRRNLLRPQGRRLHHAIPLSTLHLAAGAAYPFLIRASSQPETEPGSPTPPAGAPSSQPAAIPPVSSPPRRRCRLPLPHLCLMSAGNGTRVVHSPVPRLELSPRSPSLQASSEKSDQQSCYLSLLSPGKRHLNSLAQTDVCTGDLLV
ncbi:hypothetical protein DAI22_06g194300 [Oryza sativa Japonica Group]|nr:hypothetical protein DAI22_06g194300 [Oryza sativa Japonica Group]